MVYPKVSTKVSVPVGTPSGSLFVDVSETFGKKLKDPATGRVVPLEDCARGYWQDRHLSAVHAGGCAWLIAHMKGVICGVWRIDTEHGWKSASIMPCIPTRKSLQRSFCEVIPADASIWSRLVNQRVHLGRSHNPLRAYFVSVLILAGLAFMGCSSDMRMEPEDVALKVMQSIFIGEIDGARVYCCGKAVSQLNEIRAFASMFQGVNWQYKQVRIRVDKAVVTLEDADGDHYRKLALEKVDGKWKCALFPSDNEAVNWLKPKEGEAEAEPMRKYGPNVGDVEICFECKMNELESISRLLQKRCVKNSAKEKPKWDKASSLFLTGLKWNNSLLFQALRGDCEILAGRMPQCEGMSIKEMGDERYVLTFKGVEWRDESEMLAYCKDQCLVQIVMQDGEVVADNQMQPILLGDKLMNSRPMTMTIRTNRKLDKEFFKNRDDGSAIPFVVSCGEHKCTFSAKPSWEWVVGNIVLECEDMELPVSTAKEIKRALSTIALSPAYKCITAKIIPSTASK